MVALSGCGGGGGAAAFVDPQYAGTFHANYAVVEDGCEILAAGEAGFRDVHTIQQQDRTVTFSSSSGFVLATSAGIDSDGGFAVRERYVLEEPGFAPCDVESAFAYFSPVLGDSSDRRVVAAAESLFTFRLSCLDGFVCETRALGYSEREVGEGQPAT
jgi:hypothetical protein